MGVDIFRFVAAGVVLWCGIRWERRFITGMLLLTHAWFIRICVLNAALPGFLIFRFSALCFPVCF